jgi:hypothetical protein
MVLSLLDDQDLLAQLDMDGNYEMPVDCFVETHLGLTLLLDASGVQVQVIEDLLH